MCGIIGVIALKGELEVDRVEGMIQEALIKMNYRGPDNAGLVVNKKFAFGHVRLSIMDLNERSNQPFTKNGEDFLVYNGEIYNFSELSAKYFQSNKEAKSDTEVLYELMKKDHNLIKELNGMYAFCFYDSSAGDFHIVRDKYGIKPLYYYKDEQVFIYSSESKLIKDFVDNLTPDSAALHEWAYFGNTLGQKTFYNEIKKVEPGHTIIINVNKSSYTYQQYHRFSKNKVVTSNQKEIESQLEVLIDNAVERQLCADVNVGVFLSGGIDSSAITSIASKYLGKDLAAYTARFDFLDNSSDLEIAKKFCAEIGCDHTIIDIDSKNLPAILEELVYLHDGPFSDAANIPLYLMAKEVKGQSKVVLQGDGGDELFAGYKRYATLAKYEPIIGNKFLNSLLNIVGNTLGAIGNQKAARVARYMLALGSKCESELFANLLTTDFKYGNTVSLFNDKTKQNIKDSNYWDRYEFFNKLIDEDLNLVEKMLRIDSQIILPDVFFEKVDRATMAGSIEVRVPFLDDKLVDFAMNLPSSILMGENNKQKFLLRKVLSKHLPSYIVNAPKKGFSVPYASWLKTTLKPYFIELLDSSGHESIFDKKLVEAKYKDYCLGKNNDSFVLWKTLQMLIWEKQTASIICAD